MCGPTDLHVRLRASSSASFRCESAGAREAVYHDPDCPVRRDGDVEEVGNDVALNTRRSLNSEPIDEGLSDAAERRCHDHVTCNPGSAKERPSHQIRPSDALRLEMDGKDLPA